jgi:hypothetical protein
VFFEILQLYKILRGRVGPRDLISNRHFGDSEPSGIYGLAENNQASGTNP